VSINQKNEALRLGLPKGRMKDGVLRLLSDGGLEVRGTERGYRPTLAMPGFEAKFLKPQNIVEMLAQGSRDLGFAGADWVAELGADLVELLDTGLDPVRMVVAAPSGLLEAGRLPRRRLVVASEYERLATGWMARAGVDARFVRSYGATEVFPPEDADVIVDITQTGDTLRANDLAAIEEVMLSSTRLYASRAAMVDPARAERIGCLVMVLQSVLEARRRVMVEVNVSQERLAEIVAVLPCMREPTLSPLHGGAGYAVKAAVPKDQLARIIPQLRKLGGTDVVVTALAQIAP